MDRLDKVAAVCESIRRATDVLTDQIVDWDEEKLDRVLTKVLEGKIRLDLIWYQDA